MTEREELKCVRVECGALCVMTSGIPLMQVWYASSLGSQEMVSLCLNTAYPYKNMVFFCSGALAFSNAYFGQGTGPIHIDNVHCSGKEDRLLNCSYTEQHNCNHNADAGVRCPGELACI